MKFKLISDFKPAGSQIKAIKSLVKGIKERKKFQTLLGVTGSGKTFTMANIINKVNKPTLILAHNKTLAAQLYNEFKGFFPENRIEYFVSYYDYYQPEAYVPQKDMYIEKDSKVNQKIEQFRISTAASLISKKDVIVIASVSCIYGLGSPKNFKDLTIEIKVGQKISRDILIKNLVDLLFERNQMNLSSGKFRVKGETIDFIPGYMNDIIRVEIWEDKIERIIQIDKLTGKIFNIHKYFYIFPAKNFVTKESETKKAIGLIKKELEETLPHLDMLKAHRLKQKTNFDIEMIEEIGHCKGIENYSRHLDGRKKGEKPYCLLDYFPKDFLLFIDESHRSVPQVKGMYFGDLSRKQMLVDYGFRLPSALDNRPLKFNEFENYMNNVIFVSATPGEYELKKSKNIVEQIIRPTGLIDPIVEIKPSKNQINDLIVQIKNTVKKNNRVLVTTITKKLAEELTEYLAEQDIKARYLHSEIDTIERTEIIRELRLGKFDCLVGINLLREGIDIPEVSFVGILDADKEGFLRDARSLIQIIGRAARNIDSKVILYADRITDSIKKAIKETSRRREIQINYNKKHNIVPKTIIKPVKEKEVEIKDVKHIPKKQIPNIIIELEIEMQKASDNLDFERAIILRNKIKRLNKRLNKRLK